MFVGLEHTAIASPSPAKLAQWYVDHLGFRINFEYDGNYFVRAANGAMLEIIPSEGARAEQKMRDEGIRHLAIQVDDFDAAHAALAGAGREFHRPALRESRQPAGLFHRLRRQLRAPDPAGKAAYRRDQAPLLQRVFKAFQYRDFRLMWIGACTSTIGTWMQMVAQQWLVYTSRRTILSSWAWTDFWARSRSCSFHFWAA